MKNLIKKYLTFFAFLLLIFNHYPIAKAAEAGGSVGGKVVLTEEIREGVKKYEPWAMIDAANEIMSVSNNYDEGARLYYEAGMRGDDSIRYTVEAIVRGFSSMKKEVAIAEIKKKISEHYERIKSK